MANVLNGIYKVPQGLENLSLIELRQMAEQQQRQLEQQQQVLFAKEQRLKFLKQQELQQQQMSSENERLQDLRQRVEEQEGKLKKLRNVKGQALEKKEGNITLSAELESIKALFSDKEHELASAVRRVDHLTGQLNALRQGHLNVNRITTSVTQAQQPNVLMELERMRNELQTRTQVTDDQNHKLAQYHEVLSLRKQEVIAMDKRIAELQQRLQRKKQLQLEKHRRQQTGNKMQAQLANQKAPLIRDGNLNRGGSIDTTSRPQILKQDPKYQTLPHSIKLTNGSLGQDSRVENLHGVARELPDKEGQAVFSNQQTASGQLSTSSIRSSSGEGKDVSAPRPLMHLTGTQSHLQPSTTSASPVNTNSPSVTLQTLDGSPSFLTAQTSTPVLSYGSGEQYDFQGTPLSSGRIDHKPLTMSTTPVMSTFKVPVVSKGSIGTTSNDASSKVSSSQSAGIQPSEHSKTVPQGSRLGPQPFPMKPPRIISPQRPEKIQQADKNEGTSTNQQQREQLTSAKPTQLQFQPQTQFQSSQNQAHLVTYTTAPATSAINTPTSPVRSDSQALPLGVNTIKPSQPPRTLPKPQPVSSANLQPPSSALSTTNTVPLSTVPSTSLSNMHSSQNMSSSHPVTGPTVAVTGPRGLQTVQPPPPPPPTIAAIRPAAQRTVRRERPPPYNYTRLRDTPTENRQQGIRQPPPLDPREQGIRQQPPLDPRQQRIGQPPLFDPRQPGIRQPPPYEYHQKIAEEKEGSSAQGAAQTDRDRNISQMKKNVSGTSIGSYSSGNDTIEPHGDASRNNYNTIESPILGSPSDVEGQATSTDTYSQNPSRQDNSQSASSAVTAIKVRPRPEARPTTLPIPETFSQIGSHGKHRYAPGSVIVSTYMNKLNPDALAAYKENMQALYHGFKASSSNVESSPSSGATQGTQDAPDGPVVSPYIIDPETQRLHFHIPKPLRRRLSSGSDMSMETIQGHRKTTPSPAKVIEEPADLSESKPDKGSVSEMVVAPLVQEESMSLDDLSLTVPADHASHPLPQKAVTPPSSPSPAIQSHTSPTPALPTAVTPASSDTSPRSVYDVLRVDLLHKDTQLEQVGSDHSYLETSTTFTEQTDHIPFADDDVNSVKESLVKLRKEKGVGRVRRVSFDPLALLLDAALEGEFDLVVLTAKQVSDPSQPNDEGITALHNAICAGHYDIVKFLVDYGCDVNSPDSDGWTPLHCAASCNNLPMVKLLVEHGAALYAATLSDNETPLEKCEEGEPGYQGCSQYLQAIQDKLGITNDGRVFALFDYNADNPDELTVAVNDQPKVLRKGDEEEVEWWWCDKDGRQGYVPRNVLGAYPRNMPQWLTKDDHEY